MKQYERNIECLSTLSNNFISQTTLLMSSSISLFDKLNSNNYNTWNGDMEACFCAQALWRIVSGVSKLPTVRATPKEGEEDELEAWQLKADKAAGIMWLMVDNTQRVHFRGIKDDPVKMWGALMEVHMQKRPGTHFNAYDDLFSIRKREEEDLQSLINQVDDTLHRICDLRSTAFILDKLDDKHGAMSLIQALPEYYNSFVSSLLLKDDLDKAAVKIAFVREDNKRRRRQEESPAIGTALATSSSSSTTCAFCGLSGHSQDVCRQYAHAKDQVGKNQHNRKKDKANAAQTLETLSEFAGNTSAPSTSPSSIFHPS